MRGSIAVAEQNCYPCPAWAVVVNVCRDYALNRIERNHPLQEYLYIDHRFFSRVKVDSARTKRLTHALAFCRRA